MEKETLVNISSGHLSYKLERIDIENSFWAVCGSKKGSRFSGGGIIISDLQFLYGICHLIDQIDFLDIETGETETKVSCYSNRNRVICGETRIFRDQYFYRIKEYVNYFKNKDGEINYYKDHQLKQAGRGFFIREFDFELSSSGIEMAKEFSLKVRETIEDYLVELVGELDGGTLNLIRNKQVIIRGETPWLSTDMSLERVLKDKPLQEDLYDKLRIEPFTADQLAIHFGLTLDACKSLLNTASRYEPRFFEQGFLLDRICKGYDSTHYLVTEMPHEALEESPTLTCLFKENPPGRWPDWISATFSNDEYSRGRRQSCHFARFEIDAFEGGAEWGIVPELNKQRALAMRLFDLRRHFQNDDSMTDDILKLIGKFVTLTEETNHD
ncbi:MAG: hypothetical protein GY845_23665 [Planctomycetes bacterium]|nr:hypothetical protein [Planctomycetota bacterium]